MAFLIAQIVALHVLAFAALLLLSRLSVWRVDDEGRPRAEDAWAERAVPPPSARDAEEAPRDAAV